MSSSLLKLTLPELISLEVTSPELAMSEVTSSELASPELLWSELPLPELVPYETACLELNLMSSHLSKDGLPKFASPIKKGYSRMDDRGRWEAAIWECIPYTKIPRLPPELTDLIIDFVGGDPDPDTTKQKILYNCALVCHTWLPASRYQLFNQDLLYINTNFFKALVRASRTPSYPYAAALRAVQVIILCDAEPTWVHQFPLILGRMFSAVQELHIKDLHWDKVVIHPRTLLVSFGQFGCVTNMLLGGCTFRNFCQFRRLVCALPRLQTLRVVDSELERCETFPIAHVASPFPTFTCLVVQFDDYETEQALCSALFEWLTLMPASIHRLQRLDTFPDGQILSPLGNLLMHAGTSLEDLDLGLRAATASAVRHLNIGHCTALRKLTLRWVPDISLAEILRIISPNCRLHKLDILMWPGEVDCEWESAAHILDEQRFLTLREFRLNVQFVEIAEEEKRRISDCFAALRRRGVKFRLFFNGQQYRSDLPTISACQSKTPELQVEDGQLPGVPLTSHDDVHQSSI